MNRHPRIPRFAAALFFGIGVVASAAISGCGGSGGNGGSDPTTSYVGSWSGIMDVTAPGKAASQMGLNIQFLKGASSGPVTGTLYETVPVTVNGVSQNFVTMMGAFTCNLVSGTLTLDAPLHYDASGNPDLNSTVNLHVVFGPPPGRAFGPLTGTWTQGSASGTVTITQQTTSADPNLNAGGTWVGDSTNGGGFTPFGSTTPIPFTLSFTQLPGNALTSMVITSPALGAEPFTATLGGTVGNSVTIQGNLPPDTPDVAGFHIAKLPYTFVAAVDSTGSKMTGSLQVNVPLLGPVDAATFTLYRQTAGSGNGGITVPIN